MELIKNKTDLNASTVVVVVGVVVVDVEVTVEICITVVGIVVNAVSRAIVVRAIVVFKSVVISGTRLLFAIVVRVAADVDVLSFVDSGKAMFAVVPLVTNCISVAIVSCGIMKLLVYASLLDGIDDDAALFSNAIVDGIFSEANGFSEYH
jgi:hypothetical protein